MLIDLVPEPGTRQVASSYLIQAVDIHKLGYTLKG